MKDALKKTLFIVIPALIFVVPILFTSSTSNFFFTPKLIVLLIALFATLISWVYPVITQKSLYLPRSPIITPILIFVSALLLNLLVNQNGLTESIVGPAILYISTALLAIFIGIFHSDKKFLNNYIYALVTTTFLLAIHGLLQLTVLTKLSSIPSFMATRAFTPTGSIITTVELLIIGATAAYTFATKSLKGFAQYSMLAVGVVETIAAVAYISLMLPGGEFTPSLISYQASWSVTLDALKSLRNFIFGIGMSNFSLLYTTVKPLSVNATRLWNFTPTTATSELLQLLATTGAFGLASFLSIPFTTLFKKTTRQGSDQVVFAIFLASFISLIFTPSSITTLLIFFTSIGLLVKHEDTNTVPSTTFNIIATSVTAILVAIGIYFYSRVAVAEYYMRRAQVALEQGDGLNVYNNSIKAVSLVPSMTNYHITYSQVNLSLASALSQKSDLSEEERQQVSGLVSQAIREGKLATSLRPGDARNWTNLGVIYRNLINVAEGSDQFATESYANAIALDPANASLRAEFGNLLLQLAEASKDKDSKSALLNRSIQELLTSTQLKSDYAGAYYSLSKAYSAAGNIQAAYAAMQKAVAALDPSSPDIDTATRELNDLQKKLPTPSPSASPTSTSGSSQNSELQGPSPLPSPLSGGPIDIPEDSSAPSPTPLPTPTS